MSTVGSVLFRKTIGTLVRGLQTKAHGARSKSPHMKRNDLCTPQIYTLQSNLHRLLLSTDPG